MNLFEMWGSFAVRGIDEAEADIRSVSRVAEREFREMGDAGERATDAMEDGFKRAGSAWDSFKGNIGSEAVSRGFEFLEQGVTMLVDTSAEAQEDFGKLSIAFDKAGYSAETASSTYYDMVGLLGETDQAVEASNHLAKLCNSEEELAKWGFISAGVFAEFGDSLPLESLTEAANETAKTGQLTGALADSLNWAGISEEEFQKQLDACNTEAERSTLITQTLNDVYGESGEAYRVANAELVEYRESQAKVTEAAAEAGNAILPMVSILQNIGAALLQWATPALQDFSDFLVGTAAPAVQATGEFMTGTFLPALEKWSPVLVGVATAIGGVAIVTNASAIATGVKTAAMAASIAVTEGLAAAQGVLNAVMSANPIGIVIALIAGLVAALVVAWNTSEDFRNAVIGALEAVKAAFGNAVSAIGVFLDDMASTVATTFNFVLSTASSIWGSITSTISNAINTAKDAVRNAIDAIKGFFNFSFSWPNIPMPHFSITPDGWKVGDLLQGVIPRLGIEWYAQGGYFPDPKVVGIGDSEGGEYALPANMRSQFTRDFARAIAADMPGGGEARSVTNYNIYINGAQVNSDNAIEGAFYNFMTELQRLGVMQGGN